MNVKEFEKIDYLIKEIRNISGNNKKKNVLKKIYDTDKKLYETLLIYSTDPSKVFNIKSKSIEKFKKHKTYDDTYDTKYKSLWKLLDDAEERKISGNTLAQEINSFIRRYQDYKDIIYNIVDKNLKIGIGTKMINKAIFGEQPKNKKGKSKKLIKEFSVALADKYTDKDFYKYQDDNWYISRKFDGVRILARVDLVKKNIEYFTRRGKQLESLEIFRKDFDFKYPSNKVFNDVYYLDGEIVSINKEGEEDFKSVMEVIKTPERDQSSLRYYVFDLLEEKDFLSKTSTDIFSERQKKLKMFISPKNNKLYKIVKQTKYSKDSFDKLNNESKEKGWEGLMLRRDTTYKGKRSKDILKVKQMHDEEFKVLKVLTGNFPFFDEDGKKYEEESMTAVIIDLNNTKVGSGFSHEDRKYFYKHPEKIIGKIITVQYFEKTKDGKLRFPSFKFLHGDTREM